MRRAGFVALLVLSLGVAGYAVAAYSLRPLGASVHPALAASLRAHPLTLYAHVFGAAFALLLGPFQLWTDLRTRRPALHRWTGRLYFGVGILVGGVGGLLASFHAYGGGAGRLGFGGLALLWLTTGAMALRAIRAGNVVAHRRWVVRNFALTFAAVTLRLWLPGLVIGGVPFELAYPIVAWLCWVPNLAAAELLFVRARGLAPARGMAPLAGAP
jgi:uncharacterized membrane protein